MAALIAPAGLLREGTWTKQPTPEVALALLLDVELTIYERHAKRAAWAAVGAPADADAEPERRLIAAVGRHLAGVDGAPAEIADLAAETGDLGLVATVLAATAYAALDDYDRARALLNDRLTSTSDAVAQRLVRLHLGMRAIEADDLDDAIATTRAARGEEPAANGVERTLWIVACSNLFRFEQKLRPTERTIDIADVPPRTDDPVINRTDILLASGLDEYLRAEFEDALVNPYERTIVWRAQEPVERGLVAAVNRGEALADWNGIAVARRALGRYRVLTGVGRSDAALAEAFDLLRRVGDAKGLGASARTVVRVGPLESLRATTSATVTATWTDIDRTARLALLSNAADLLDAEEAAIALDRVLDPEVFVRLAPAAHHAAAALLGVVAADAHNNAARRLLQLARDHAGPLLLQSLPRPLQALRWPDLDAAVREQWLEYVREHLGGGGDESLLAESVAVSLAGSDPDQIAAVARDAWSRRPALATVAIFLDGGVELPRDVGDRAIAHALASLREIRANAAKGEYGLGTLSVALILFHLLQHLPDDDAWRELAEFIVDPLVGMGDKTRTLEAMAADGTRVDVAAATILKPRLADLDGFADELGASGDAFHASALSLALKLLGAAAPAAVMAELLDLATSENAGARLQAARTLPGATNVIGAAVAATLLLGLCADRHPDVRAHAARSLASFPDIDEPLQTAIEDRLRSLLADAGTLVPQAAIAGFADRLRAGHELRQDLLAVVARLKTDHPCRAVRANATTLFELLEASGK